MMVIQINAAAMSCGRTSAVFDRKVEENANQDRERPHGREPLIGSKFDQQVLPGDGPNQGDVRPHAGFSTAAWYNASNPARFRLAESVTDENRP